MKSAIEMLREFRANRPQTRTPPVGHRAENSVVLEAWEPTTQEDLVEHRRRVLDEEPQLWWWKPRYELVALERMGVPRTEAVEIVRSELREEKVEVRDE